MYDRRQRLIEVFEDTQKFYTEDPALASALAASRNGTKLYAVDEYPDLDGTPDREGTVSVTKRKTFEAAIVSDCQVMADILGDTTSLDEKITATQNEINEVVTLNNAFIRSHAATGGDRDEFAKKPAEYDERFKKADARLSKLHAERKEHLARSRSITAFAEGLLKQPLVLEQWDDQLWNLLVLKAVVSTDGTVAFTFKGENTITVRIE